jgi:hypothetical protein
MASGSASPLLIQALPPEHGRQADESLPPFRGLNVPDEHATMVALFELMGQWYPS